jgi:hypothetical protein
MNWALGKHASCMLLLNALRPGPSGLRLHLSRSPHPLQHGLRTRYSKCVPPPVGEPDSVLEARGVCSGDLAEMG